MYRNSTEKDLSGEDSGPNLSYTVILNQIDGLNHHVTPVLVLLTQALIRSAFFILTVWFICPINRILELPSSVLILTTAESE